MGFLGKIGGALKGVGKAVAGGGMLGGGLKGGVLGAAIGAMAKKKPADGGLMSGGGGMARSISETGNTFGSKRSTKSRRSFGSRRR